MSTLGKREKHKHPGHHKVDEVINALIHNPHVDDASKLTGVALRTIYRWLTEDDFKTKLREAKRELFEEGNAILRAEYKKTCLALVAIRDDQYAPYAARLTAMRTIMEYGSQLNFADNYDERLEKLESKTIDATPVINAIDTSEPTAEWVNNNSNWYSDESSDTPN